MARSQPNPESNALQRQRILLHAAEHGDPAASERFNVPRSTIRQWRSRANRDGQLNDLVDMRRASDEKRIRKDAAKSTSTARQKVALTGDELTAVELRSTAKSFQKATDEATKRLREILPDAKNVQQVAVAMGISADKSQQLLAACQALEEHEQRMAEGHGQMVAEAIVLVLTALGIPLDPCRPVFREVLEKASRGEPMSVSPEIAEAGRKAIFERYAELVHRHDEELAEEARRKRPGLPAPAEPAVDDFETPTVTEIVKPAPKAAKPAEEPEPEVVDPTAVEPPAEPAEPVTEPPQPAPVEAEVVPDPPSIFGDRWFTARPDASPFAPFEHDLSKGIVR